MDSFFLFFSFFLGGGACRDERFARRPSCWRGARLTPFVARRARQAALVRPELVEPRDACQSLWQRQSHVHLLGVVEPNQRRRELVHESIVGVPWIKHDGKYGLLVALGVDVHEMQLSTGAVIVYRVVSRGVDMPAGEVHGLVVVGHGWVLSVDALGVLQSESRAVTPVPEFPRGLVGIVKGRDVVQRKAVVEAERNWRLLGPSLAKLVL